MSVIDRLRLGNAGTIKKIDEDRIPRGKLVEATFKSQSNGEYKLYYFNPADVPLYVFYHMEYFYLYNMISYEEARRREALEKQRETLRMQKGKLYEKATENKQWYE